MHIFQLAIEKMVWHFSVGQKTAEMTSKMGGYSVNICASTRADICIFLYIKNVNGSAHRTFTRNVYYTKNCRLLMQVMGKMCAVLVAGRLRV